MRQHLHARRRPQRLHRAGGGVATVGLAAILAAAATVPASAGALAARSSLGAPFDGVQVGCAIDVAYTHLGTPRDDSLHVPAQIRANVSDVRGAYTGWGAQIEVRALGLGARFDMDGHAELGVPSAALTGRDSVAVTVRGLGHRAQTVAVRLTPGTVATITATLCLMPNDGPMAMQLVTTNARPGVACRMLLSQPDPSSRVRAADSTTPAVIRATITDTAGAPVEQAMVMLAIHRSGSGARPFGYTDSHGRAMFVVPGKQLTNADSMVISVRRIGFGAQHLTVQIVPGDTGTVTAVLCPHSTLQVDFVETRPRDSVPLVCSTRVVRVINAPSRGSVPQPVIIRVVVRDSAGKPLTYASGVYRSPGSQPVGSWADTSSVLVFRVPGSAASTHATLSVRRLGYVGRNASISVSAGDTVVATAVLCLRTTALPIVVHTMAETTHMIRISSRSTDSAPAPLPTMAGCLPSASGGWFLANVKAMASGDYPHDAEEREHAHMAKTARADVQLVQDSTLCAAAAAAYDREFVRLYHTVPRVRTVYVVQVGASGYAIADPTEKGGEWIPAIFVDPSMTRFLGNWAD